MAEFDFATLGQYLQPSEEDRKRALQSSLMVAGLGMLANNQGHYGALGPALGAGGLMGMQNYTGALEQAQKARAKAVEQGLMLKKLQESMEGQKLLSSFGQSGGPAAMAAGAAQGDVGPTTTNAARIGPPNFAPLFAHPGIQPERVKGLMSNYELQHPKLENVGGYAQNMRQVQPGQLLPSFQTTPDGRSIAMTPNAQNQPVINVPQGSPEAVRTFADIGERSKAEYGPPVKTRIKIGGESREVELSPLEMREYFNTNKIPDRFLPKSSEPVAEAPSRAVEASPSSRMNEIVVTAPNDREAERLALRYRQQGRPFRVMVASSDGTVREPRKGGNPAPITEPIAAPASPTSGGPLRTDALLGVGLSADETRDIKSKDTAAGELAGIHAKRVGALEEKIPSLNSTLRRLDRLEALNADDKTFAAAGAELKSQLGSIAQAFGLNVNEKKTANTEEYMAHVAELLKERLSSKDYGSGTGISNLDLATAGRPLPEVMKTQQGRTQVITALRADTQRALADAAAARDYFGKNKTLDKFTYPSETETVQAKPKVQNYTDADLRHTALKHGLTVEQVKQRLGIK